MKEAAKSAGVAVQFNRLGSMFCAYFAAEPVHNLAGAMKSDRARFAKYFHGMLERGGFTSRPPNSRPASFPPRTRWRT
jgi:glutamate-1-semialdehyde 2,1-aminomutase